MGAGHVRNHTPGTIRGLPLTGIINDAAYPGVCPVFRLGKVVRDNAVHAGRDVGQHVVLAEVHIGVIAHLFAHIHQETIRLADHALKGENRRHQILGAAIPGGVDRNDIPILAHNQLLGAVAVQIRDAEAQLGGVGAELHPGFDSCIVSQRCVGVHPPVVVFRILCVCGLSAGLCFCQRFLTDRLGLHSEVKDLRIGFQRLLCPAAVILQCLEHEYIIPSVCNHKGRLVHLVPLLQDNQHVHAAGSGVRPLLIGSHRANGGIELAEAVLSAAGVTDNLLIRPDGIRAGQGHAALHGEGAVGIVPHAAEVCFGLCAGAENSLDAQRLASGGFIGVNIHFPQQLQIVLGADFIQLVFHIPGVEAVGVIVVSKILGERLGGVVDGIVRVIALQPIVPFLGSLIPRCALHALQGQHGSILYAASQHFMGFLPKGHILQPQDIYHRTAHQQQRQGNQGGDEPQFPPGQALRLPLPERFGGSNIAVLHVVQAANQIHSVHTTYPSSRSTLRSLPRVLWSMEATLLWLNPVIFPMASTESIYQ